MAKLADCEAVTQAMGGSEAVAALRCLNAAWRRATMLQSVHSAEASN